MKSLAFLLLLCSSLLSYSQDFDIYVSDAGNFNSPPWQIVKYDSAGQNPIQFIGTDINWPQDILFLEDTNIVLISSLGSNRISRHDAQNGAYLNNFATGISGPTRMKIGPDGYLYALQWSGNGKVRRYMLDGTYIGEFTNVGVNQSIGLDWDRHGNLYVSSYALDNVRKFDTAGNDMGVFINSNLVGPTNIWFDGNGDLLVVDYDATAVKRFDSLGVFKGNFMQGLNNAEGVAMLPNGNILIGNGGNSAVKMYDSTGTYIRDLISSGTGSLLTPNAVIIREKSNISVKEAVELKEAFLFPSQGRRFELNNVFQQRLSHIEIRNLSGELIHKTDSHFWNASEQASGAYIASMVLKDGQIKTQKIIVE